MTSQLLPNDELKEIRKILKFGIPSYFRIVGLSVATSLMIFLLANKFFIHFDIIGIKGFIKSLILLSGLVAVLAIDDTPDERYFQIRGQAFTISFLFAGCTGIILPWFNYIVNVIQDNKASFEDDSAFVVLFTMFFTFLLYSAMLKRFS